MSKKAVHFPSQDDLLESVASVPRNSSLAEVESGELPSGGAMVASSNISSSSHSHGGAGGERGVGKRSIVIMLAVNFLANVVFSIVIPSLWDFLTKIDKDVDKSVLGWAIACNSAGTFISAPLLGAWADKWNTRGVMVFSLLLMIAGNCCYSLSYNLFPQTNANLAMLMVGRFTVGFAAGNFAVVQAYFSYATKPSQRLAVMSWNAGTTVIGFVVGPAIAAACQLNDVAVGPVHFNTDTLPGFVSGVAALLGLVAIFFVEDVQKPSAAALAREGVAAIARSAEKTASRRAAFAGERQALLGGDGKPSAAAVRAEPSRRAESVANYGAWLFGGSGYYQQSVPDKVVGASNPAIDDRAKTWAGGFPLDRHASIVAYGSLSYNDPSVRGNEALSIPWLPVIICLLLNFAITLTFTALETIGPPYTKELLDWGQWQNGVYFMVLGFICILSLAVLQFVVKCISDRAVLPLTCLLMSFGYALDFNLNPADFPPIWCFYVSSALTSIGYAAGTAVLIAIYSKVLEGLDQGMFMGAFSAACSIARIVGPLGASYVLQLDPHARWVFGGISIMLFVSAVGSALSYRVLKPRCESLPSAAVADAADDDEVASARVN